MNTSFPSTPRAAGRFRKAFLGSLVAAGLLSWIFAFQALGPWWHPFGARPASMANLLTGWGYAFFHASPMHLVSNGMAILLLGTLAYGLYPRALVRAIPLALAFSYAAIWLLGDPGSIHIGTSGITYGLMAMVATMGLVRKDRPARGAGLVVFLFFGGAWWATLPGYPGVSWEGHLGGAIAGILAAMLWRKLDPTTDPPSPLEDEEAEDGDWIGIRRESGNVVAPPCPPGTRAWTGETNNLPPAPNQGGQGG